MRYYLTVTVILISKYYVTPGSSRGGGSNNSSRRWFGHPLHNQRLISLPSAKHNEDTPTISMLFDLHVAIIKAKVVMSCFFQGK